MRYELPKTRLIALTLVRQSYFDQANHVARLLGIKLTSRVWDKQNIPMCGFPIMHLDKYLKVLVQQHKRFVAMCEEFPRYTNGQKPEFDRRVVRVITPGTLIDESFLNPFENNFLLAISANTPSCQPSIHEVGLAWIDVSTGEFFTKTTPFEGLKDELARISPREIVLAQELRDLPLDPIRQLLEDEGSFLTYVEPSDSTLHQYGPSYTLKESVAINILTTFMQANLMEHMPRLSVPNREGIDERMQIDSHTIKALEIHESAREGGLTGSLLSVINRTVTSSGMRSLTRRLCLFSPPHSSGPQSFNVYFRQARRVRHKGRLKRDSRWLDFSIIGHICEMISYVHCKTPKIHAVSSSVSSPVKESPKISSQSTVLSRFGQPSKIESHLRKQWNAGSRIAFVARTGPVSIPFYQRSPAFMIYLRASLWHWKMSSSNRLPLTSLLQVILQKAIRSLQALRTEYTRGPFGQSE